MKNKFLSILLIAVIGSFLLNISIFIIARVIYNFESNITLLNIHLLDYFNNGFIEQVGTPVEIYHNSQTEFVCDFIGDINVLTDETVHGILLNNAHVFLEDKKGYIRLEKVRFKRETDQDFVLKGSIIDVEFSGVTIHYTVQVSENQILNVTSIDSQSAIRSVGESVELFITPSDVLQF